MTPLFPNWTNTVARLSLLCLVVSLVGALGWAWYYTRLPFFNNRQEQALQPIEFDHRHHVVDDKIDCRYCHDTVETSSSAGIPSTSLCLNCHAQIWNKTDLLAPIRRSAFTGAPFAWRRVHQLADYVYFNHSIHVNKGVGCVECHGRVDEEAAIAQQKSLQMGWCIDCHKDPAPHLRPREYITSMTWTPPVGETARQVGEKIMKEYNVHTRTSCTTCHR